MTCPATILHAIDTGGSGGAETVFAALVGGLDSNAFPPVAAVASDRWLAAQLRAGGVQPAVIPARGGFNLPYLLRLVALIRRSRPALIHSHLFGSNLYCALAGRLCGVPVVAAFHGEVDIDPRARLLPLKLALVRLGARRVVCVSEQLRARLIERGWFRPERLITIHNGVDTARFTPAHCDQLRARLGLTPQELLIGAVGNIRRPKRYDLLIQAAALLRSRGLRFRLLIAGQGEGPLLDRLLGLRSALGLDAQIEFVGFKERPEQFLNSLDLFVLSSDSEGFSIATIEAMACGLPVVATRSGGPEEIVTDGVDGLLVAAGRVDALAEGLERLLRDGALRARLGRHARETVVQRFSLAAMTEAYGRLYGEVLRESGGQPDRPMDPLSLRASDGKNLD